MKEEKQVKKKYEIKVNTLGKILLFLAFIFYCLGLTYSALWYIPMIFSLGFSFGCIIISISEMKRESNKRKEKIPSRLISFFSFGEI